MVSLGMIPLERFHLKQAVNKLLLSKKFTVVKQGNDLLMVKILSKRPITIRLKYDSGKFWIENPDREDRCVNSFFELTSRPRRVTRNKDVIRTTVRVLQETGLWHYIENKGFFEINKANKTAKKDVVKALYDTIRTGG